MYSQETMLLESSYQSTYFAYHNSKSYTISKCIEVNEGSRTSVKVSLLTAGKCFRSCPRSEFLNRMKQNCLHQLTKDSESKSW